MSVRPMIDAEVAMGHGHPMSGLLAMFGLSQGVLAHLNTYGLRVSAANWFPTP